MKGSILEQKSPVRKTLPCFDFDAICCRFFDDRQSTLKTFSLHFSTVASPLKFLLSSQIKNISANVIVSSLKLRSASLGSYG